MGFMEDMMSKGSEMASSSSSQIDSAQSQISQFEAFDKWKKEQQDSGKEVGADPAKDFKAYLDSKGSTDEFATGDNSVASREAQAASMAQKYQDYSQFKQSSLGVTGEAYSVHLSDMAIASENKQAGSMDVDSALTNKIDNMGPTRESAQQEASQLAIQTREDTGLTGPM